MGLRLHESDELHLRNAHRGGERTDRTLPRRLRITWYIDHEVADFLQDRDDLSRADQNAQNAYAWSEHIDCSCAFLFVLMY